MNLAGDGCGPDGRLNPGGRRLARSPGAGSRPYLRQGRIASIASRRLAATCAGHSIRIPPYAANRYRVRDPLPCDGLASQSARSWHGLSSGLIIFHLWPTSDRPARRSAESGCACLMGCPSAARLICGLVILIVGAHAKPTGVTDCGQKRIRLTRHSGRRARGNRKPRSQWPGGTGAGQSYTTIPRMFLPAWRSSYPCAT